MWTMSHLKYSRSSRISGTSLRPAPDLTPFVRLIYFEKDVRMLLYRFWASLTSIPNLLATSFQAFFFFRGILKSLHVLSYNTLYCCIQFIKVSLSTDVSSFSCKLSIAFAISKVKSKHSILVRKWRQIFTIRLDSSNHVIC